MAAAPARSSSRTDRRTPAISPYPVSASVITGTEETLVTRQALHHLVQRHHADVGEPVLMCGHRIATVVEGPNPARSAIAP